MTADPRPERKAPTGTIAGPTLDTTWQTPPELLAPVRAYFGGVIPFDPATAEDNPTGAEAIASADGLDCVWSEHAGTFVNPPYGRVLRDWLAKMVREAGSGAVIISLLPCARWEQAYFQEALAAANVCCFIRKRVNFIRPSTGDRVAGNPYANMFLAFNVDPAKFARAFACAGVVLSLDMIAPPPAHGLQTPGPGARAKGGADSIGRRPPGAIGHPVEARQPTGFLSPVAEE